MVGRSLAASSALQNSTSTKERQGSQRERSANRRRRRRRSGRRSAESQAVRIPVLWKDWNGGEGQQRRFHRRRVVLHFCAAFERSSKPSGKRFVPRRVQMELPSVENAEDVPHLYWG
ncbi:hypothetical protein L596_022568 [Steinernema carpocapsae]|uniref:Uncharacterized protein n=1 Tax=Steinernema carpocapsae TaxID=34508 RepID=A0A4U5MM51_STECR|nr:hypothetical protein L596_022568 [Steinernema carpocapsae]